MTISPTCSVTSRSPLAVLWLLVCSAASAHKVHDDSHAHDAAEQADARAHLAAFRRDGDDAHLEAAWSQIAPHLDEADPARLLDAALIAQARHDFDEALAMTRQVLDAQPGNDQAWLLVNAIEMVRGNRAAAAAACRSLERSPLLVILTCQARASAGDEIAVALERLAAVLESAADERSDRAHLAWSHSIAGDLAVGLGREFTAIDHYRRSLAHAESSQVRSALVDSLLRVGWHGEAQRALDAGSDALPLHVRRLIVARSAGRENLRDVEQADRRFREWIDAEDWLHAREMARFYIDVLPRPALAARLARINLEIQREPEDVRLHERTLKVSRATP